MTTKILKRAMLLAVRDLTTCPLAPKVATSREIFDFCTRCKKKSLTPGLHRCYQLMSAWYVRKATTEIKAKGK